MKLFNLSKKFPPEERYSLADQMRRSSRSICSNLAEAWRKRRYEAAFVSKLNDCEGEAAETQVWIQYAVECQYLDREAAVEFYSEYDAILGMLVNMVSRARDWTIPK
jgi:four helix bundle protein